MIYAKAGLDMFLDVSTYPDEPVRSSSLLFGLVSYPQC